MGCKCKTKSIDRISLNIQKGNLVDEIQKEYQKQNDYTTTKFNF